MNCALTFDDPTICRTAYFGGIRNIRWGAKQESLWRMGTFIVGLLVNNGP